MSGIDSEGSDRTRGRLGRANGPVGQRPDCAAANGDGGPPVGDAARVHEPAEQRTDRAAPDGDASPPARATSARTGAPVNPRA
eukprot:5241781-Alexandrium_andersonii.AAC.1